MEDLQSTTYEEEHLISAWTPATTRVLRQGGSGAWNVLDYVVDGQFHAELCREVEPFLEELKPARTTGDVQVQNVLSLVEKRFGNAESNHHQNQLPSSSSSRGDRSRFLSRDERNHPKFCDRHPRLTHLLDSIQDTVQHHLEDCLELNFAMTSVQLAVYPGDGTSGYPRHCDRSGQCCQGGHSNFSSSTTPQHSEPQRVVTAIYYLTPDDWHAELDGGCLRLFDGSSSSHDVVPYPRRLVVFRSDGVEHQVMPSLKRPRTALTVWLYGWIRKSSQISSSRLLPSLMAGSFSTDNHQVGHDFNVNDNDSPPPLPLQDASDGDDDHAITESIFVSIAAYRDSELAPTIQSLVTTAQHPERVYCGIVLQLDPRTDSVMQRNLENTIAMLNTPTSRIRVLSLDARHAQGPCFARDMCQRLYRHEDYFLQVDSHMRFRPSWDTYLIQQLCQLGDKGRKCMLTAYPVGYHLPNRIPNETRGTLLVPWKFDAQGLLRQRGRLLSSSFYSNSSPPGAPIPCHLYAAGFNFARARVLRDCPYDGQLRHLFFGEEISMAVRLYTHGYDLYAPPETVCYHLWSRAHRPTVHQDGTMWNDDETQILQDRQQAQRVVQAQLAGKGRGLGKVRSAFEFQAALGVDFDHLTIQPDAVLGGLRQDDFAPGDDISFAADSIDYRVASLNQKAKNIIASFLGDLSNERLV